MIEDENGNRKARAMVQMRAEVACTREAIMEVDMERGTFQMYLRWH